MAGRKRQRNMIETENKEQLWNGFMCCRIGMWILQQSGTWIAQVAELTTILISEAGSVVKVRICQGRYSAAEKFAVKHAIWYFYWCDL